MVWDFNTFYEHKTIEGAASRRALISCFSQQSYIYRIFIRKLDRVVTKEAWIFYTLEFRPWTLNHTDIGFKQSTLGLNDRFFFNVLDRVVGNEAWSV
jgi:hypothetical protein